MPKTPIAAAAQDPSPGSSAYERRLRARVLALLPLALVVIGLAVYALGLGADRLTWSDIWGVLQSHLTGRTLHLTNPDAGPVVWELRAPRIALGLLVGGGLAGSGAIYQSLFRNPMADPYVIGVSSGAALGAVIQVTLHTQLLRLAPSTALWASMLDSRPLFAFCGGVLTIALVYRLAVRLGRTQGVTLLLAGITVSLLLSAIMVLLMVRAARAEQFTDIVFWLMGGLQNHGWSDVLAATPGVLAGLLIAALYTRAMNVMLLGEETARQLGISPARVQQVLLAAATLATASAVAFSGLIGFIGFVAPHVIRLAWGPDHRTLLPASVLAGAGLLVLADGLARTLFSPEEIPVGIVTAILGAPVFLALLSRRGG